jgi:tetratricopeptide (TPR) repeat protein
LAEKLIREGNLDEAMKWIGQALATNPNDARAILTKGRILKRQAMKPGVPEAQKTALLTQALDCVNRSIDLTPPDQRAEPIYNKACYEALLGFADKAVVATLQAAFQLKPELRKVAAGDNDLERLWQNADFIRLTGHNPPANH